MEPPEGPQPPPAVPPGRLPLDRTGVVAVTLLIGLPILLLVGAGGPAFYGGLAALVCVWISKSWIRREKVIATTVLAGAVALIIVLAYAIQWPGMSVLVLLLLWPIGSLLAGLYLAFARRRRIGRGEPA
jgi:hypothetical protein